VSYLQLTDEETILASNKGRAHFTLSGYHFNPDEITRLLGIEPTSVNRAGASSGLDKPVISSWELSTDIVTGDEEDVDVYALTDIIIKQLEPIEAKILEHQAQADKFNDVLHQPIEPTTQGSPIYFFLEICQNNGSGIALS
jgi:hypothetical protein